MRLKFIRLENFKSFKNAQFDFPQNHGLYFITGRNEVNTKLGANGTGKTTLWDAFCWLLFEKTPKGLKAGDLAPWGVKSTACVTMGYTVNGREYEVARTWNPNKWKLTMPDGSSMPLVADDSNLFLAHMGHIGFSQFLSCILMAQGQRMFLDLKPDEMASIFGGALQLDSWVDFSIRASKSASVQDTQSRFLESQVSRAEGVLDGLQAQHTQGATDEWETKRNEHLAYLEKQHIEKNKEYSIVKCRLSEIQESIKKEEKRIHEMQTQVAGVLRDSREKSKEYSKVESEVQLIKDKFNALEEELEKLPKQQACPTCHYEWSARDKRNREAVLREGLGQVQGNYDDANTIKKQSLKLMEQAELKYNGDLNELRTAEHDLHYMNINLTQAMRQKADLGKKLDSLEEDYEKTQQLENPVKADNARLCLKKEKLEDDLLNLKTQLEDSQACYSLKHFWIKGFKDIRLQEITEALTQLELEVNNCIEQLGLIGWEIRFAPDSETKSGTVKRGFSVKVLSPENKNPVPWAAWSGGEAQRLRLAGNMGMANLIRQRAGVALPIEIWDEPTQFLSPQGVSDLLHALRERAQNENRQIWVVDHRSLGFGGFSGSFIVVKDKNGSSFAAGDGITN